MSEDKIRRTALKYALQNAIHFDGRANEKAVVGKVISIFIKEKISPKEIIPLVKTVVNDVNKLTIEKQTLKLKEIAPELLIKEKKERDFSLPELSNAKQNQVVTRFPPEPNGYLHIGHAKAAIIDYEYAKKYNGKFILRFDDTNPENAQLEFYDAQKEDLKWLNVKWDQEYNTSDNLKKHYLFAEQLINQNDAYVCTCTSEQIKKGRYHGIACNCRKQTPEENLDKWKQMISKSVEKDYILRLTADLKSLNTAMRDPTLFRIINKPHPRHGTKYSVWPTYDFAGAVEDSIGGVTHPFRTKEYELRDECYFFILEKLNLRKPYLMEFSRLSIEGMPVSKRKIKPLIENGQVNGYDDIRLPTLQGLKRRGITADAIKQFVLSQGISKVESSVDFSILESINRKQLDSKVKRYYFVPNPIKIIVKNAPEKKVKLKLHPTADFGTRQIDTKSTFYISKEDLKEIPKDEIFRLKGLYNVKIIKSNDKETQGEYAGDNLIPSSHKIQWTTDEYISMKIQVPHMLFENDKFNPNSLEEIEGFAENSIDKLKHGETIQFERFGFVRIERQDKKIKGYFTHK